MKNSPIWGGRTSFTDVLPNQELLCESRNAYNLPGTSKSVVDFWIRVPVLLTALHVYRPLSLTVIRGMVYTSPSLVRLPASTGNFWNIFHSSVTASGSLVEQSNSAFLLRIPGVCGGQVVKNLSCASAPTKRKQKPYRHWKWISPSIVYVPFLTSENNAKL